MPQSDLVELLKDTLYGLHERLGAQAFPQAGRGMCLHPRQGLLQLAQETPLLLAVPLDRLVVAELALEGTHRAHIP